LHLHPSRSLRGGSTKTYTLDDVLKMKEKDWFSRGIALSPACNVSIVDNSLEKLEGLRQTGTLHQLIAVACSVDHAKSIRTLYEERGYKADVIHSDLDEHAQEDILRRLRSGELDCIVQVQMLGEGFDHPKLSVAAIFRPFRSLAPYIQFVGRVLRVIVQNDPTHPDNYGHVVTHAGMNLDQRLKEFRLFEKDDQKFWDEVIGGKEPEPSREVASGAGRMRNAEMAIALDEIADSLIEDDLVTSDDEELIKELERKLESLGLDPSAARALVVKQQNEGLKKSAAAEPFPVLPQREWEECRRRLKEKVNRSANMLLNRLALPKTGRKLVNTGIAASNDLIAAITLINNEIKKSIPAPRQQWSSSDFKSAMDNLDKILNDLTRKYKGILHE
jgi:DNA repair protein RadD